MSRSLVVEGIKPADDKYNRMYAVWKACTDAKIPVPKEVELFFNGYEPNGKGVTISLDEEVAGVSTFSTDWAEGYDIDLNTLDKSIRIIRVWIG